MKKILMFATAFSPSIFAYADLQKINEAEVFIADNTLALQSDAATQHSIKNVSKEEHLQNKNLNHTQNLALAPTIQAKSQDLISALSQMTPNGLKIQIPSQTVSYGTINMGMGDIAKGSGFTQLPDLRK